MEIPTPVIASDGLLWEERKLGLAAEKIKDSIVETLTYMISPVPTGGGSGPITP
jgi:hypothetical protein